MASIITKLFLEHKWDGPEWVRIPGKSAMLCITMSNDHLTDTRFSDFDLHPTLQQGIEQAGFERCTPIQSRCLPQALEGHDILGQAQTGTGKTAAFLIAACHRLLGREGQGALRCLIVAPTRELAVQIHRDAQVLAGPTGLRVGVVYGGTGYESQKTMLADGLDILIGTPGRIIDYHRQRLFTLKHIEVVVLDEADRMFDLGFIRDIRYLLRAMPPPEQRLSMLFSATMAARVRELAYEHMNEPVTVTIEAEQVTADRIEQSIYYTANEEKIPLLLGLLANETMERILIFANTRHMTTRIAEYLRGNGYETAVLSGDVPQKQRLSLLKRFQQGELRILVATDVAARGLHIEGISHVINFDLPQDAEDYVHRIGRTARAGASGHAVSFACEQYAFSLPEIEAYIGNKIPVARIEPELLVTPKPRKRSPSKGREGRPSGRAGTKNTTSTQGSRRRRSRRPRRPN